MTPEEVEIIRKALLQLLLALRDEPEAREHLDAVVAGAAWGIYTQLQQLENRRLKDELLNYPATRYRS